MKGHLLQTIILLTSLLLPSCKRSWVDVTIDERIQMSFPGQPILTETKEASEFGSYTKKAYFYKPTDILDENEGYQFASTELPPKYNLTLQQVFDDFTNQEVILLGGKLISKNNTVFKGVPACETLIDIRNGEFRIKTLLFISQRTVYNIGVITEKSKLFNTDVNKFINSFKYYPN